MVKKLNELGVEISIERVREIAGTEFIGRPHIARAMLKKGYISDIGEAFTGEYIGRGGKAYVERFKITPCEAIELILKIGGVPVLAHPGFLSTREPLPEEKIYEYIECGLRGIEAIYSRYTEEQKNFYLKLAEEHDLVVTGGSDCHGKNGEGPLLGTVRLDYGYVELLKKERRKIHNDT